MRGDGLRVLGIDPGSRITGYGVVDMSAGRLEYVASGCIRTIPTRGSLPRLKEQRSTEQRSPELRSILRTHATAPADGDDTMAKRLGVIYEAIELLIATHKPFVVAIEQVFVARNVASALKLGQARGAVLAAVVANRLPVAEYAARRVKQAVTGTGAGDKSQVQHMVRVLLNLSAPPASDAADALAVAICHHHAASSPLFAQRSARRSSRRR